MTDPFAETLLDRLGVDPDAVLQGEPPPLPAAGQRYTLVGEIGRGGIGRVLKVYDHNLKRHVAMKVLLGKEDPYLLTKFLEEAQIAAQLEHPSIVGAYDVGLDKEGNLFFTMRLIYGETLREILERLRAEDPTTVRSFTPAHRLRVFQQICQAVAYAHSKGVIHRDLKPDNVMIGKFGEVLVMDWGIAKVLGKKRATGSEVRTVREDRPVQATVAGTVVGTPLYMSPEQATGGEIDARSDVYSLGALLYELTTLKPPVSGGTSTEVLKNVERGRMRALPDSTPRELAALIRKATSPNRDDRYSDARALAEDVDAYLEGRRGEAWEDNPLTLAWKWIRRHRALTAVSAAAVFLLAGFWVYSLLRPGELVIETVPAGAEIWIDGKRAWGPARVSPGKHEVVLRLDRHEEARHSVVAEAGSSNRYRFILYPLYETVRVESSPSEAEVEVAGFRGKAPFVREIPRGTYRLVVRKEGFLPHEQTLLVEGGGKLTPVVVSLSSNWGRLVVRAPQQGIQVWDGDRLLAALPAPDPIPLAPGRHRLRFELENHHPELREISVAERETASLSVILSPILLWSHRVSVPNGYAPIPADLTGDRVPDWVVTTGDGRALAFDGLSGSLLWNFAGSATRAQAGTLVGGSDLVHSSGADRVTVRSARDGKVLGHLEERGITAWTVGAKELLYSASNSLGGAHLPDGRPSWKVNVELTHVVEQLIPWKDTVVMVAGYRILSIAPPAATRRWEQSIRFADARGAVCLWGDRIAAADDEGNIVLIAPDDGTIVSKLAGPAGIRELQSLSDGHLLVRTDQELRVLSAQGKPLFSIPARFQTGVSAGDMDGDATIDFAFATRELSVEVRSGKDGTKLWSYQLPAQAGAPPGIADLDGDGVLDLLVLTRSGAVALRGPSRSDRSVRLQDMDRGAVPFLTPEACVLVGPNRAQVLDFDGSIRTDVPIAGGAISGAALMGDQVVLATDDAREIRIGKSMTEPQGRFLAISPRGEVVGDRDGWMQAVALGDSFAFLTRDGEIGCRGSWRIRPDFLPDSVLVPCPDVNGDGRPELLVAAQVERRWELLSGKDGSSLRRIHEIGVPFFAGADLDGDGRPEILSVAPNELRCVRSADGRALWRLPGSWRSLATVTSRGPAVVLRKDGREWVRIVSPRDGTTLREFPVGFGDETDELAAIGTSGERLILLTPRTMRVVTTNP